MDDKEFEALEKARVEKNMPFNMMQAKEDGFCPKVVRNPFPTRGSGIYIWEVEVKCDKCGHMFTRRMYKGGQHLCEFCKRILRANAIATDNELEYELTPYVPALSKNEKRFSIAQSKMPKRYDYSRAIELARTKLNQYDSVPEAMVAIELIRLGYKVIPQQTIAGYRVDFCLPDIKLIIEVDGSIYHSDTKKEIIRESVIRRSMPGWLILHLPAGWISKHIYKLQKCIEKTVLRGQ